MNSKQRRKQRRKNPPRKVWSFGDVVGTFSPGLYQQQFGRINRIPLEDTSMSVDEMLKEGATATNARPDSKDWANLNPAQILADMNELLKGIPLRHRNPFGLSTGGGKTEKLRQMLNEYEYKPNLNATFGKMGNIPSRPFYGPSLSEMIKNHLDVVEPTGPEILAPEETALAKVTESREGIHCVPTNVAMALIQLGLATPAEPEYQPGGSKFHEVTGEKEPLTLDGNKTKPRLTEGE